MARSLTLATRPVPGTGGAALAGLVSLWALLACGFFGTNVPQVDAELRVAAQAFCIAPFAVYAGVKLLRHGRGFDVVLAAGILAALIVALASHDTVGSLETVGLSAAYVMIFWGARAATPWVREAVAIGVSVALIAWLIAFAVFWSVADIRWIVSGGGVPDLEPLGALIWNSQNNVPALALLCVPFVLEIRTRSTRWVLVFLLIAGAIVAVPLSSGRAGWLGLAVAGLATEALLGWPTTHRVASWLRRRGGALVGIAVLALVLAAGLVYRGPALATNTIEARLDLWRQAIGIVGSSPWVGGGQSTFGWLRLTHAPDYAARIPVYVAHNVVLQTLADGGALLAAGFGLVVASVAFFLWRRRDRLGRHQRVSVAVLLGYAATSLLDDFSANPALSALVIAIAAWVIADLSLRDAPTRRIGSAGRLASITVVLVAIAALPAVVAVDQARLVAANGVAAAEQNDWRAAVTAYRTAAGLHPGNAGYHLALALSLYKTGDLAGARREYLSASEIAPGDARSWGGLSALSQDLKTKLDLLGDASRAGELTAGDAQYSYRLAIHEAAAGNVNAAAVDYARAVTLAPGLLGALPQGKDLTVTRVLSALPSTIAALERPERIDGRAVQLDAQLMTGDLPNDAPPAWLAVLAAERGDQAEASRQASLAIAKDPWASRSYLAQAVVAWFACDAQGYDDAIRLEALTVDHFTAPVWGQLNPGFDPIYRETGLGDYQPDSVMPTVLRSPWPMALLRATPTCSWAPAVPAG